MATRYTKTKDMFDETYALIHSNEQEYTKFLEFASKHYKYSFQDVVLIYNQRPNATAVTNMSNWNSIFQRRVIKNTKSIGVFDRSSSTGLRYLFDVDDTHGQAPPAHWKYEQKHEHILKEDLYEKIFSKKPTISLENDTLGSIIYTKVMDDCEDRLQSVLDNIENSALESNDDIVVENKFRKAVIESVSEIVEARTGIDCEDSLEDGLTLYALDDFNTYNLKACVHTAINEIAKDTLVTIEKSIKKQEQLERSTENGIHKSRTDNEPEHDSDEKLQATNELREIRKDGSILPRREEQSESSVTGDSGNIVGSVSQSGRAIERDDVHIDGTNDGERPSIEPSGHSGISTAQSDDSSSSGRSRSSRDSVSTEIKYNTETNQEVVDDTASFSLSKNEDISYTDELAEKYNQGDIETVLLLGSGFEDGKQRIVDFFSETHTSVDKINFLKNEYGTGGGTTFFSDDRTGYSDHDAKGITINNFGFDAPSIKLTWSKVAKGIEALIENGKYFEPRNKHDTPPIRRSYDATLLSYADNDISLKEYGYLYEQMEKVPNDEAMQAFDNGTELYLLYDDNTENLVEDRTSLSDHINDGGMIGKEIELVSEIKNDDISVDEESQSIDDLVTDADIEFVNEQLVDEESDTTATSDQIGTPVNIDETDINFNALPVRQNLYSRIKDLAPHIIDGRYDYQKMQTYGFMDFNIDNLGGDRISMAHNYIQNGDLICDPDVVFTLDHEKGEARPFSFQNDGLGIYRQTFNEDNTHLVSYERELTTFTIDWLSNVKNQGHITTKASYSFMDESNPTFNENGLEYGFDVEVPKDRKLDYSFADDFTIPNGQKTRYNLNVDAIKTLKKIESEDRLATDSEQEVLAHYVGWGGIPNAFDDSKTDWSNEYTELKDLLSVLEYSNAKASTLNAHYTNPTVISAMYSALSNFDFDGGKILEPAMGTGNFFSSMPKELRDNSSLTGVEIDGITARIAKQLHQSANIQESAFENTGFKDNSFDVVIGNVPFGSYKIEDKLIHDYFVNASIDKVKDGGIVAVITSKGTLDKKDSSFRQEIAKKAELIGAVRLPNDAFKLSAGTSVTTDILFFQKKPLESVQLPSWVHLSETDDGVPVNTYFAENPDMILGEMQLSDNMYGRQSVTTCVPFENADLSYQLENAVSNLSAQIDTSVDESAPLEEKSNLYAHDYPFVKNFSYISVNDNIYYRENKQLILQELSPTHTKRMLDMFELRSATRKIIDVQINSKGEGAYNVAKENLNNVYDNFVKSHGNINSRGVSNVCRQDADYPLLSSLEVKDEDKNFQKADIFFKPTIKPHIEIDHVSTSIEALSVSKNIKGEIDIGYMATLSKQDKETVLADLEGIIFRNPSVYESENPYKGFETAETYLSGDVRAKLHLAKAYAKDDRLFDHNVKALEEVQPKDLTADQIDVRLGTTWIPDKYYRDFICEKFELHESEVNVDYSNELDQYILRYPMHKRHSFIPSEVYGTSRMHGFEIFQQSLNLKKPRIVDYDEDRKAHFNAKETFAVRDIQEKMMNEFRDWIYAEPNRRNDLVKIYNENFNNIRVAKYDGTYLTLPVFCKVKM